MNAITELPRIDITPVEIHIPRLQPELTMQEKVERTITNFHHLFDLGHVFNAATSHGKDSSVMCNILLTAAISYFKMYGFRPHIRIVNSNTLMENPLMDKYSRGESIKIQDYVSRNISDGININVQMDTVSPSISNNYIVAIIGGRTIASLSDNTASCSVMTKVEPITRHKKKVLKEYGLENVITLVGKRYDESSARKANMELSGENPIDPIKNKHGEWILSPIADFTTDDILEYIGEVLAGVTPSYSDFTDLAKVYKGANGGDCMINVIEAGKSNKTGCGQRTGCWSCNRVEGDTSMENMLNEPEYAYMKPLNRFREVLKTNHYDPAKRNWLARSVDDDGMVAIGPNTYSPSYCEDLLRYAITIDANEQDAAYELGIEPRFTILTLTDIIQIELMWARHGYHTSAKALSIWNDIYSKGKVYNIPEDLTMSPKSGLKITNKKVRFCDDEYDSIFSGFRSINAEIAGAGSTVTKKDGSIFSYCNEGNILEIDQEGAELFFGFELQAFLEKYSNESFNPTHVYHYFVGLGTVTINKGGHSVIDKMLRMSNQIHRHDLVGVLNDPEALTKKLAEAFTVKLPEMNIQSELF